MGGFERKNHDFLFSEFLSNKTENYNINRVSDHVEIRVNHVLTTKITYTNPSQEV